MTNLFKGLSHKETMAVLRWVQHNPKKWDKGYYGGKSAQRRLIKKILG